MAASPVSPSNDVLSNKNTIVISGISGIYPESNHVMDFSELLYKKVNPIKPTDDTRWQFKHPELLNYTGNVPRLEYFDTEFFKLGMRVGSSMDVMARKLMEQTYQAIFDAGLSPSHLAGRAIGVFVGSSFAETERASYTSYHTTGSGLVGCAKTMFANRISYWLDINGPSFNIDDACCSSIGALEAAYLSMKRFDCEAAIVGAGHLALHPHTLINFNRLLKFSNDGKTKSFDVNAAGFAKSEAITVLFLQRAEDALRIYAELVNVKNGFAPVLNDNTVPKMGIYRNLSQVTEYLKQFYKETNISPSDVEYVEAFGAATADIDKAELDAIDNVFCVNRKKPLLVGSVMSNIGYTEAGSGAASVAKVLLGYHKGQIAANLHYENPRGDVLALKEGRLQIVTENRPINRSYIAINNFSYNGLIGHVLLKGYNKQKEQAPYRTDIPRLVTISGRNNTAVKYVIDNLKSRPIDFEELALLHNIHEKKNSGHLGRGYVILDTNKQNKTVGLGEQADYYDGSTRPLWFVYSGMGSQWNEMGAQLMRIPVFAGAIHRCQKTLEPFGVDVIQIMSSPDKSLFDHNIASMVGIVAIQIALTDVLGELGVVADKYIGHSLGEIGCAYADGGLTLEEAILSAYYRGLVSTEVPVVHGAMAAVGVGAKQIRHMLPEDIVVACHNGPDSCTLSGPSESMSVFISELTAKRIFAKMVESGNIAYHSKYIAAMDEPHLYYLRKIMKEPKLRSSRWISTSVPMDKWNEPEGQYLTPEYLNNNMTTPVLFEEGLTLVPSNAVLVEIAPHGLLQAILKRSLSSGCRHIPLTKRKDKNNVVFLFNAIGRIYMEGFSPKIANLYPKVQFPVSTETPFLSHLVKWAHDVKLDLPLYVSGEWKMSPSTKHLVTVHDQEYKYLRGNIIRGKVVYPFSAALIATWDTLAVTLGLEKKNVSVQFRDVHLFVQPMMHEQKLLKISVILHRGTGQFEVSESSSKIATGYIIGQFEESTLPVTPLKNNKKLDLKSEDVYELLLEKGFEYRDEFRSIYTTELSFTEAQLVWRDWVTLLDGMFQLNTLKYSRTMSQPSFIKRICIDVNEHLNNKIDVGDKTVMAASINEIHQSTRCGGITIHNIKFHNLSMHNNDSVVLEISKNINFSESYFGNIPVDEKAIFWKKGSNVKVTLCNRIGDLESFHWEKAPICEKSGALVKVYYAGVNDCDIKRATGVIPLKNGQDIGYGMDFSGIIESNSGDRVMGLVSCGSVSSSVIAQRELLWNVPPNWSLEDAASVPLAYCLAFYCLSIKTQISQGMKILVLGGAGALGQAAISIALAHGCTVFTTVSTNAKKQLILNLYPQIKEKHIVYSRDIYFGDKILMETDGAGCDIVISCVPGELRNIALNCCAFSGTTLDTVQIQSKEKFAFGFHYLTKQRSYVPVDFSCIFTHNRIEEMKKLHELIEVGISKGYVRPITYVSYGANDVIGAFKLLQSNQRSGRVLIRLHDPVPQAKSSFTCSPDTLHVVICGNRGVQLVDKLIIHGARKVRLHCLHSPGYLSAKIREWQNLGVDTEISSTNIDTIEGVHGLLNSNKGIVEGIYIIATDLTDQTVTRIDLVSRKVCPNIKYFLIACTKHSKMAVHSSRIENHLPVTTLCLPQVITDVNRKRDLPIMTWIDAVEAMEQAIDYSQSLVNAHLHENVQPTLLNQIAWIADLKISKDVPDTTTLASLGVLDSKIPAIAAYLRDNYNVYFEREQIRMLTLKKIKKINDALAYTGFKDEHGLETFFSNIDTDEVRASVPIVYMKTRANYMKINEFDAQYPYLIIIPGVEGHYKRFNNLCKCLKLPALVLQPGFDTTQNRWEKLPEIYAQILLTRLKLNKPFYILGYESGVPIALELSLILEKKGLNGTVFCIGLTPNELPAIFKTVLKTTNVEDSKVQDAVALHMSNLILKNHKIISQLESLIPADLTWSEKVAICVDKLLDHSEHTPQYINELINSAYVRIKQVVNMTPVPQQLNSKIVFIRSVSSENILEGLSKHPVTEYKLKTPLRHILQDLRCATIINQHLSSEILELFEENHQSEKYVHNGNSFKFVPQ